MDDPRLGPLACGPVADSLARIERLEHLVRRLLEVVHVGDMDVAGFELISAPNNDFNSNQSHDSRSRKHANEVAEWLDEMVEKGEC